MRLLLFLSPFSLLFAPCPFLLSPFLLLRQLHQPLWAATDPEITASARSSCTDDARGPKHMPERERESEREPDRMPGSRMSEYMSNWVPDRSQNLCHIESLMEFQILCRLKWQIGCQIECQMRYQIICQLECQLHCQTEIRQNVRQNAV